MKNDSDRENSNPGPFSRGGHRRRYDMADHDLAQDGSAFRDPIAGGSEVKRSRDYRWQD